MTYKAYIDNIKAETGKNPGDFVKLAKEEGLIKDGKLVVKHMQVVNWLKSKFGLGHGHAQALVFYMKNPEWAKKKIAADSKRQKK